MKIISENAIVIGLEKIDLNDFPNLKVIGCNMTSCEHLPLEEMERRGIKLISLKDYPTFLSTITSTAEHTIGLVIALLRNYKIALNAPYKDREEYKGHTLAGKTLLVIGRGRVGKQVIKIATAFGMGVLSYDITDRADDLLNLIKRADIISIHIPLE